ncbi:hypothetical protein C7T94_14770 [Pedobacter yulinensis]|uniref:Uncharacterized protein n=1 Tax=Pedobacter yulinensis TaxID=2126353 RepID=A0A2T3HHZ3_9SPHI|nr:fasciclin domain-containing protein [Pedobacter yulinensis]PST82068.1 hypothetical protein C7T94_14770 [Pedobacter yulinensis]
MAETKAQRIMTLKNVILISAIFMAVLGACKRDEYYLDGGKAKADYPGSMMKYFEDKKVPFDTIANLIKLAGLEPTFAKEDFTFFAPDDDVIKRTVGNVNIDGSLNNLLFWANRDTIKTLNQVNPAIWKKFLQRYMFRGNNRLKDYTQIDPNVLSIHPGGLFYNYNNEVFNIGVIFYDANQIKYGGYRQLVIHYIPDVSRPKDNWIKNLVASSDIKPTNGVVHTLAYEARYLGFNIYELFTDILNTGLSPAN